MNDETVLVLVATAVAAVLVLLVALLRLRRQTRRALAAARAERDALFARLEELESAGPAPHPAPIAEYVITEVGSEAAGGHGRAAPPARLEGRLFADVVLRESVVKAASLAHGVRRALSPESRNRIRFEMRREVRRSSRQRRADVKEALRQYYARERGDVA